MINNPWKHVKTGHFYEIVSLGVIEKDGTPAVIYRRVFSDPTGPILWIRPLDEFMDGRFKRIEKDQLT